MTHSCLIYFFNFFVVRIKFCVNGASLFQCEAKTTDLCLDNCFDKKIIFKIKIK